MSARTKHGIIAAAAVLLAGGAVAWFVLSRSPKALDPARQSHQEVVKYLASAEFEKLPKEEKTAYFGKLPQDWNFESMRADRESLSEEEQGRLRKSMRPLMQRAMDKRVHEYFALPPEKRKEYMDKVIDEMQQRMAGMPAWRGLQGDGGFGGPPGRRAAAEAGAGASTGAGNKAGPGQGRGGRFTPEQRRLMMESVDPVDRAQRAEFSKQLRQAMAARGISSPRGR